MTAFDVSPYEKMQSILDNVPNLYDIDLATGTQLDTIGEWVGASRMLAIPITGVYFEWGGTDALLGWLAGIWKGQYDPVSGLVSLPDDSYRRLLKAKIVNNQWNGSVGSAYDMWESLFLNSYIMIIDNQDMTISIAISGAILSTLDKALLTSGVIAIKPMGVSINSYIATTVEAPMMAFDVETSALDGWDFGAWYITL